MTSPKHSTRPDDLESFRLSSFDEHRPSTKLLEDTEAEAEYLEDALSLTEEKAKPPKSSSIIIFMWILVNTFATIGIVSSVKFLRVDIKLKRRKSRSSSTRHFSTIHNSAMHS